MNDFSYRSPEFYDKHGNAKPNLLFWLSCIFLARAWFVFVVAGVSREQGTNLLSMIYPSHDVLYMGLGMGVAAVGLMLMAGNLHRYPSLFARLWCFGKPILLVNLLIDLGFQCQHLKEMHWRFEWSSASVLLITIWLLLYLLKSQRIQFLFTAPINRVEEDE